jgi:cytochrome b561
MALGNAPDRFGPVTRLIHWLTAAAVLGLLGLGTYVARMEVGLGNLWLFGLHKSLGLTVLALTLLRLAWHLASPPPPPIAGPPFWQMRAARATHAAFYALLIAVPLAGWIGSSASGIDTVLFGLWTHPAVAPVSERIEAAAFAAHGVLTKLLLAAVLLHVAGAVKRVRAGDGTLRRMVRGTAGGRGGQTGRCAATAAPDRGRIDPRSTGD